jgi:hypothetical protein
VRSTFGVTESNASADQGKAGWHWVRFRHQGHDLTNLAEQWLTHGPYSIADAGRCGGRPD